MQDKIKDLKGLRIHIKEFAAELINEANGENSSTLARRSPQLFSEGAWIQFLFLLKFWVNDSSAGFEKIDLTIEKSVTTIFNVFESTPLSSIADFGKFSYKESFL